MVEKKRFVKMEFEVKNYLFEAMCYKEDKKRRRILYYFWWRKRTPILIYHPKFREYELNLDCSKLKYTIQYDPWLGAKFPSSLRQEWLRILKEEYGLSDPLGKQRHKVPKEFKTEEWWKKRGLEEDEEMSDINTKIVNANLVGRDLYRYLP